MSEVTQSALAVATQRYLAPIVDYEPTPVAGQLPCPPPTPQALHRRTPRPLPGGGHPPRELPPPRAAAVFADAAVRRVLEVLDRRRPAAALRPLLTPPILDTVMTIGRRKPAHDTAVLRRLRVRAAESVDGEATAAEVFGTFTRGTRVHAFAGRIEVLDGRWRVVALHLG